MDIFSDDLISPEEYIDKFLAHIQDRENKCKLILAGRNEQEDKIKTWLSGDDSTIKIYGESREEVCLFIAATALQLDDQEKENILTRLTFIEKEFSVKLLEGIPGKHILIPLNREVEKAL